MGLMESEPWTKACCLATYKGHIPRCPFAATMRLGKSSHKPSVNDAWQTLVMENWMHLGAEVQAKFKDACLAPAEQSEPTDLKSLIQPHL